MGQDDLDTTQDITITATICALNVLLFGAREKMNKGKLFSYAWFVKQLNSFIF